ncbi:hypothetical protein ACN47E_008193 [Coniothyrium glycines]
MNQMDHRIARIEAKFGYTFKNVLFCAEALQMLAPLAPVYILGRCHSVNKNTNLAIFGDAALTMALCAAWDEKSNAARHSMSAGSWNTLRNDLLANDNIARIGFGADVHECILTLAVPTPKMVATTFEAIIGAICRDAGSDALTIIGDIITRFGFHEHPLLMVTLNNPP